MSGDLMIALSVISNVRSEGARPPSDNMPITSWAKSGWLMSAAETLTENWTRMPAEAAVFESATAWRRTKRVSSRTTPVSSASGTKRSGGISPSVG